MYTSSSYSVHAVYADDVHVLIAKNIYFRPDIFLQYDILVD